MSLSIFKKSFGALACAATIAATAASCSAAANPLSVLQHQDFIHKETAPSIGSGMESKKHIHLNIGGKTHFGFGDISEENGGGVEDGFQELKLKNFDEYMEEKKEAFNSDVDAAFSINDGRRSPYGSVGCAETVAYAGSYYSEDLREAYEQGIASVPRLVQNLSEKGYEVEPFNGYAEKGDLLIYGNDDHVVIADGQGGCFGNSSSRMRATYYPDAAHAWGYGQLPSKVVRLAI